MKYSSDRVFEAVQTARCSTCFGVCLHEGGGPQVGEVTCGKLPHLTGKRDHIKMREYLDRRVTSPTWSPPPPCKLAVKDWLHRLTVTISRLLIGRDDMVPRTYDVMVRQFVFHTLITRARKWTSQTVNVTAACGYSWVLKNGEQFFIIGTLISSYWS